MRDMGKSLKFGGQNLESLLTKEWVSNKDSKKHSKCS